MSDLQTRLQTALGSTYRVERELGGGGMSRVYVAEEVALARKVVVKVLPPEMAAGVNAERFRREIQLAASLQHPHIVPLLNAGQSGDIVWYTMPLIEGESLRARLARDRELPVAEAVRLLRDVADALAYAHEHGVVHRDIKPDNVLVSRHHAVVTDFGVAKAISAATGESHLTSIGVALGTPAYMSPEQAAASPHVDHRADLYALGAMAYEMLTGAPPFEGSPQMVLAAHVTQTPAAVSERRAAVPAALATLVMRCLEKKAADRYQSAAEVHQQLDLMATPSGGTMPTTAVAATQSRPTFGSGRMKWAAGAVVFVVAAGILAVKLLSSKPLTLTTSNAIAVTNAPGVEYQPALSPDGAQVAFAAQREGRYVLGVRSAVAGSGSGELRPAEAIPGDQTLPSWSPDGEFIRFWNCAPGGCAWKQVGRLGGAAQSVELPRQTQKTAWSRDGSRVVFAIQDSIFIHTVTDRSTRLLAVHPDPWGVHSPTWSPDGRWIAFVSGNLWWPSRPNTATSSIWIVEATDGKRIALTSQERLNVSPAWLDAHHLLFVSNRDGPREVFAVEVGSAGPRGAPQKVAGGTDAHSISVSADGRKLTVSRMDIRQNVWAYPIRAAGTVSVRDGQPMTTGTQAVEAHDVSRDGQWLLYDSNLRGTADIYKLRLAGGEPIPLVTGPSDEFAPRWSPDGREVTYYGGPLWDVFVVSSEGGTPTSLTNRPGFDLNPVWSPDGLRIAFESDRTGRFEVWLLARERVGAPWGEAAQLTTFGCGIVDWAPDGSGVLCWELAGNGKIALVSRSGAVLWRRDLSAAGFTAVGATLFSGDGTSLYLSASHGGRTGIWSWPLAGGEPRLLVAFDDPRDVPRTEVRGALNVHGDHLYLTVAQYESDIWVMDLKR
jgi:serine/threonine-protein kinase